MLWARDEADRLDKVSPYQEKAQPRFGLQVHPVTLLRSLYARTLYPGTGLDRRTGKFVWPKTQHHRKRSLGFCLDWRSAGIAGWFTRRFRASNSEREKGRI